MIYNLTHSEDGQPIQRLAITTKVSIGLPADPNNKSSHPTKLDHFYFTKKSPKGEWVKDEDLTKFMEGKYGAPVREFDILVLDDDIEAVFSTEFAWWSKSEKKCSGDGREAFRRTSIIKPEELKPIREKNPKLFQGKKEPALVPWTPCGDTCPDLQEGRCKPSGQLVFMLADRPKLGAVSVYYTTSYTTVSEIYSSLAQIQETARGRLKYIPMRMSLRPGTTRYQDTEGKPRKGNAFFVHLEFREDDHRNLLSSLVRQSLVFDQAQAIQERGVKLLGSGEVLHAGRSQIIEEVEALAEGETAAILSGEFSDSEPAATAAPATTEKQAEQGDKDFENAVAKLALNKAQRDMILARFQGDLEVAGRFLKELVGYKEKLHADGKRVSDWISQGVQSPKALLESLEKQTQAPAAAKPEPSKPAVAGSPAPAGPPAATAKDTGPPDPEPPQVRRSARSQEKKKDPPPPPQEPEHSPPQNPPSPPHQAGSPPDRSADRGGESLDSDPPSPPPAGAGNWDGW